MYGYAILSLVLLNAALMGVILDLQNQKQEVRDKFLDLQLQMQKQELLNTKMETTSTVLQSGVKATSEGQYWIFGIIVIVIISCAVGFAISTYLKPAPSDVLLKQFSELGKEVSSHLTVNSSNLQGTLHTMQENSVTVSKSLHDKLALIENLIRSRTDALSPEQLDILNASADAIAALPWGAPLPLLPGS